ncbi:MAG: light-harvesting protein [Pseudomonadota bacterium]
MTPKVAEDGRGSLINGTSVFALIARLAHSVAAYTTPWPG